MSVPRIEVCTIPGCSKPTHRKSRYCGPHRYRIEKYGSPDGAPERPYRVGQETFDRLVLIETDVCVLWPHTKAKGYGWLYVPKPQRTGSSKGEGVHVLACIRRHGPPPSPRYEVAHSCRTPACMNYRHLRWATRHDNMMDRVRDGTHNRGERHSAHKLTAAEVVEMRRLRRAGRTYQAIADRYGVSFATANDCINGRTWAWLTEEAA